MSIGGGRVAVAGGGGGLAVASGRALKWRVGLVAAIVMLATALAGAVLPTWHSGRAGSRHVSRRLVMIPATLAPTASAAVGASERRFWPTRHGSALVAEGGGIRSTFSPTGAELRVARGTLGLSLIGIGHDQSIGAAAPRATKNEVLYEHASVSEFYRNGPYGLEQGFTVHRPVDGTGLLGLGLRVSGSLQAVKAGSEILFKTTSGATALRYNQLKAFDATGRLLPSRMRIANGNLQLQIDDRTARYPLHIDPFIQQGSKLTGGGEVGPYTSFGTSVAFSSDGSTALIGGREDNGETGAAWVFTRSGSTWTQQGAKLTATGELGEARFGWSVALSENGNTALVSGPDDNKETGAVWVFTRSGTTWSQQAKLIGSAVIPCAARYCAGFGWSVALSGDGNTALVGDTNDNGGDGAAWIFARSGSTWTQQGSKMTEGESDLGISVGLSSSGNTALIGGYSDSEGIGAAWVLTRSGTTWSQQAKLVGTGASGAANQGWSVALSNEGNTAVVGGPLDRGFEGAAWVFTRSGSTWTQQGSKLTFTGAVEGHNTGAGWGGVAVSSSGNTALIGTFGDGVAAFTRSGTTWTQEGSTLWEPNAQFGESVALSSDGNTALIGGPGDSGSAGAAWVFVKGAAEPPAVTGISPTAGLESGGTSVTITGAELTGATAVKFGPTNATSFKVNSPTSITATSPAGTGTVDVTVTTPGGTSTTSSADQFSYVAPGPSATVTKLSTKKGPAAGGTSVTITGTSFEGVTAVKFGATNAASYEVNSAISITAVSPPGTTGTVEVAITTPNGQSGITSKDHFTYEAATVTNVSPNHGPVTGETPVTVTGTGFAPGAGQTLFEFRKGIALSVNCASINVCTMTAPAAAKAGVVDVRAQVGTKTSKKNPPADQYTYE